MGYEAVLSSGILWRSIVTHVTLPAIELRTWVPCPDREAQHMLLNRENNSLYFFLSIDTEKQIKSIIRFYCLCVVSIRLNVSIEFIYKSLNVTIEFFCIKSLEWYYKLSTLRKQNIITFKKVAFSWCSLFINMCVPTV